MWQSDRAMNAYLRIISVALIVFLPLVGCSGSDLPMLSAKPDVSSYHLGPGDVLEIRVLGADELNGRYSVQDDGTIRMLMAGDVPAAGFTPEQVQNKIEDKLKAGRYVTQPRVTVVVSTHRPYFILGEILSPGAYPYVNGTTVLSAVAAGGGYTRRANQDVVVITRNGEDSRAEIMTSVLPGDTIRVLERSLF